VHTCALLAPCKRPAAWQPRAAEHGPAARAPALPRADSRCVTAHRARSPPGAHRIAFHACGRQAAQPRTRMRAAVWPAAPLTACRPCVGAGAGRRAGGVAVREPPRRAALRGGGGRLRPGSAAAAPGGRRCAGRGRPGGARLWRRALQVRARRGPGVLQGGRCSVSL